MTLTHSSKDGIVLKSFILSAGLGTRLRPLTDFIPKPLAPICNIPLFDAALKKCIQANSLDIAINVHHLSCVMKTHAQQCYRRLGARSLHVSEELPEILGTGGALVGISDWWGVNPLLVYNGDILSDMSLEALVATHFSQNPLVTMAVRPIPPTANDRSVWVNNLNQVVHIAKKADLARNFSIQNLKECSFACAYVADSNLKQFLPAQPQFFDIIEGFNEAIKQGQTIRAVNFDGFWADIGNPRSLWEANLKAAAMPDSERMFLLGQRAVPVDPMKFSAVCTDKKSVISHAATIHENCRIHNSVILGNEIISQAEIIENSIRGYGLNLTFTEC